MASKLFNKLSLWLKPRLRLWSIYNKLGYIPWHKKRASHKEQDGVFKGTGEAFIPFLNDDAKRTFSHLFLRPGYMMRDYIFRGEHERYLAPFTALLVFYSVFTLLVAILQPGSMRESVYDQMLEAFENVSFEADSVKISPNGERLFRSLLNTATQAIVITHLDLYPQKADTPWKESLAAVEDELRSKGIPMFLGDFLLLWMAMALTLRKKYSISVSGAAAASAYILCQFCIFMFLALILSLGQKSELNAILAALLLFIDYRQLLGTSIFQSIKLTLKVLIVCLLEAILFYLLVGGILLTLAYFRV